ncbi:putative U3 small nucleolar RNA-associated protein 11 [Tetrabaena socialis]|uniref:Putative U3 small nucleolar RNA-associated protein 11 n=1 Tax=Tetrabaena socialis TaxID=47790 RepID=A0A2J8A9V3_9CHLO|nr:putative U3 small nucleolar RNA-associated protein 11 [Tetrabaena socialis]|eukprot:PNH09291.1 putative U3 small nucleolar RNA-associated protein 11 [Tetrabaena socialis]
MKTQDVKYLAMKATTDANKALRMRQSLHFIGATAAPPPAAKPAAAAKRGGGAAASKPQKQQPQKQGQQGAQGQGQQPQRHTVFVDSKAEAAGFDAAAYFDTPAELLDRTFNRPRAAQLADRRAVQGGGGGKGVEKRKYAAYKELAQRQDRGQKVAAVAQRLSYQKEVMGKGRKRKLRPAELEAAGLDPETAGKVFVWKRERKR